jgi:hypothetical protein
MEYYAIRIEKRPKQVKSFVLYKYLTTNVLSIIPPKT